MVSPPGNFTSSNCSISPFMCIDWRCPAGYVDFQGETVRSIRSVAQVLGLYRLFATVTQRHCPPEQAIQGGPVLGIQVREVS